MPLNEGPFSLFFRGARIIIFSIDSAELLKFITALIIPLIDLWLLLLIPIKEEAIRISLIAGILAIFLMSVIINNPNKVIVYSTTFPGHISVGLLFIQNAFSKNPKEGTGLSVIKKLAGLAYLAFCLEMFLFYIFGTPLEWYY
ncbi:hypothetical protein OZ401_005048 (plasmid) [Candidatus Chlorohelix allophototropha]|uniref:Uncharacterized protein n=1 Tax=Candidatus Chlorohelix allophototropha TaxID=3003348 RepID=A0ABY9BB12_9CHLR|nr:hypothetical protein OZ401_005048 [Chloroflexota bacterium L227-S17]